MFTPSSEAFQLSPLFQELRDIDRGLKELPPSQAKRHHFVSEFLLRRFATDGRIFQLDVKTGQPRRVGTRGAASRRNFYTFESEDGDPNKDMESFLALVESHSAPAIEKLLRTGALSDPERATLSFFFALLALRTPAARRMVQEMAQQTANFQMASHYGDPGTFARMYREYRADETVSDAEAEELRERTLRMLQTGELALGDADGGAATGMLLRVSADFCQSIFGEMEWRLLRSDGPEFVTSDRGVAIYDPTPKFPWSTDALLSSPNAQTSVPLAPGACMLLRPGRPSVSTAVAEADDVAGLNLRTYGWADGYVFGHTQAAVTAVRRKARGSGHLVKRPKPFRQVVLVESQQGDTRLADAHRRKGWPPYLGAPGDDGAPRRMDYMVIGEDGDPVEVGVTATEIAKRRALARPV